MHHLLFFTYVLAYFVLLKVFLTVFYFISNFFKRRSLQNLTQISIKISEISYFSFSFKLKKAPLKKRLEREGYKKKFAGGGADL